MPWWAFMLRACAVYVVLLVMVRVAGKRSMGQFTPFDMILVILLGNAVQNSLIGKDDSLQGGLLLAATLIALNSLVGYLTSRFRAFEVLLEGRPVKIATDGKIDDDALKREMVTLADFEQAMREAGLEDRADILHAWIETDGDITILPKKESAGGGGGVGEAAAAPSSEPRGSGS